MCHVNCHLSCESSCVMTYKVKSEFVFLGLSAVVVAEVLVVITVVADVIIVMM